MKKIMPIVLFTCSTYVAGAQMPGPRIQGINPQDTSMMQERKRQFLDSLLKYKDQLSEYYKNMPPGAMPKKFSYLGNTDTGLDIYQTPYDNMYILRPDSTFYSNMPTKQYSIQMTKPAEPNIPKSKDK